MIRSNALRLGIRRPRSNNTKCNPWLVKQAAICTSIHIPMQLRRSAVAVSSYRSSGIPPPCSPFRSQSLHSAALNLTSNEEADNSPYKDSRRQAFPDSVLQKKPWLDVKAPVQLRVKAFLSASQLHPNDLHSGEVFHLIKQCCRLLTQEGLGDAQDVVERLVVEKKRRLLNNNSTRTASTSSETETATSDYSSSAPSSMIEIKIWEMLVFGWARAAAGGNVKMQRVAPLRMKELMERAMEEAKWDEDNGLIIVNSRATTSDSRPTVDIFNAYLYGLSQAATTAPSASLQAQTVLEDMDELHAQLGWHCRPNTKSYSQAITACANSHHERSGDNALKILRRMQQAHAREKETYLEKYHDAYNTWDPSANRRRIVTADAVAYTTTMNAIVRSGQKPQRAISLLREMIECNDGTVIVDSTAFLTAMQAFAKMAASNRKESDRIAAARQCEEILSIRMECAAQYSSSDVESDLLEPKGILLAYNACLDAWSKVRSPEAVVECERIVLAMLQPGSHVRPNTTSLHACLHAWSRSDDPTAASRAHELLQAQQELVSSGILSEDARPDCQSFALLILTVAKCESYDGLERLTRARCILQEMVDGIKNKNVQLARNACAPFSAVLTAAAASCISLHSNSETPAHASLPVNDADVFLRDDGSNEKEQIYTVALKTYQEAKEDVFSLGVEPDHHLYSAMLRVLAATLPEVSTNASSNSSPTKRILTAERVSMAHAVLSDAKEYGQVSRLVVHAWLDVMKRGGGSQRAMEALLGPSRDQIPRLWSRNVPPEFRFRGLREGKKSNKKRA